MTRPSAPRCDFASLSPLLARALNERSFMPPMSVTRRTRIFLPAGASVDVVEPLPPAAESDEESSSPHAAAVNTSPARPIARIDLDIPFLNTPHLPVLPNHVPD